MSMNWEEDITDNGKQTSVMDGSDNVSASALDLTWDKVLLSFDDLSLVNKFKLDNET